MNIKTIIVEDEFLPRETLLQKLQEYHPDIEVVTTCEDAEKGLIEILRLQPQLLFLDIQLPNKNGLWLANELQEMRCESFTPPAIIFTTAFDDSQYMLNAFKIAAIDYLIKPILIENLDAAIARFKNRMNADNSFSEMIQREKLIKLKNWGGLLLLRAEEIAYLKADGNYAELFMANGENESIFERLGEIEKRLPDNFERIGKSLIINRNFVRRINLRNSTCQLVTPKAEFEISVSADGLKRLKGTI